MTKHTAGPWAAEFGEAYKVRAQQDGGLVAILFHLKGQFGMSGRRDGDEVAANARLIAAAPELFEALKEMIHQFDQFNVNEFEARAIKDARAAIANAEGKSK